MRLATAGKLGVGFQPDDRICFNRAAAPMVAGDLVMIDIRATDTTNSLTTAYGLDDSKYTNIINPSTGARDEDQYNFFGVILRGGGVDEKVLVRFNGRVTVNTEETNGGAGATTKGEPFYASLGNKRAQLRADGPPNNKKLLGVINDVIAQGATVLAEGDLFGITGIGATT
jgi:hypothetical protein